MSLVWRKWGEWALIGAVFIAAGVGGWLFLMQPEIRVRTDANATADAFLPALMWATGHGFTMTTDSLFPDREFLDQQCDVPDMSAMASNISTFPAESKFIQDRQYLLYTIGVVWRIFGVSWTSVKGFLAFVLALIAVLTYGIFRLGMNRILSLTGTLLVLTSPVFLAQAAWTRSICKAPFILAAILIVGYLLVKELRPRTLLFLAILSGMVIGIGFGFRQDAIIGLPPLLAAFVLGARVQDTHALRYRFLAIVLMAITFVIFGWPSIHMTHKTGGNNSFYLAQGWSCECAHTMDLEESFYFPLFSTDDFAVHSLIADNFTKQTTIPPDNFSSVRALFLAHLLISAQTRPIAALPDLILKPVLDDDQLPIWSRKAELSARNMVFSLYRTFPADVITRWYGATLRIVRSLQTRNWSTEPVAAFDFAQNAQRPIAEHLERFGFWYACIALIVISAKSLRLSLGGLLLLLYFSGYTSLEFQIRHAFHLNFVSFWSPLFLLGVLGNILLKGYASGPRGWWTALRTPRAWTAPLSRMVVFVCLIPVFLCVPLYAARWYQRQNAEDLFARYQQAELSPVEFSEVKEESRTYYLPEALPAFQMSPGDRVRNFLSSINIPVQPLPMQQTEYLVMEMETTIKDMTVSMRYEDGHQALPVMYQLSENRNPSTVRLFYPISNYSEGYRSKQYCDIPPFQGIVTPPGLTLKKLYRVRNVNDFPLLMTVWMPENREQIRWGLELPPLFSPITTRL